MVTLTGAWRYRVSAGTGWTGVSILRLGEVESLICAASISVWQHVKLSEQIRPRNTLAYCWDAKQPTNQQTNLGVAARQIVLADPPLSYAVHVAGTLSGPQTTRQSVKGTVGTSVQQRPAIALKGGHCSWQST